MRWASLEKKSPTNSWCFTSRFEVGSSSMIISVILTNPLHMDTFCIWPAESSSHPRSARPSMRITCRAR